MITENTTVIGNKYYTIKGDGGYVFVNADQMLELREEINGMDLKSSKRIRDAIVRSMT